MVFETLTGQRTFEGKLISDALASVLKTDPNWQALPVDTPPALQRLLRRCLEKDPRRRLQAIGEMRVQIDDLLSGAPDAAGAPVLSHALPRWLRALPWGVAATAIAGLMLMLVLWAPWRAATPPRVTRMTITPSGPAALTINATDGDVALSPDGTHVVYVGNSGSSLTFHATGSGSLSASASYSYRSPSFLGFWRRRFQRISSACLGVNVSARGSVRRRSFTSHCPRINPSGECDPIGNSRWPTSCATTTAMKSPASQSAWIAAAATRSYKM
jgi:serine/threonine protein kinase